MRNRIYMLLIASLAMAALTCAGEEQQTVPGVLEAPSEDLYTEEDAVRMVKTADGVLAPVYAPLAEQIVKDFDLGGKAGIGIDLGAGPGNLTIELCKRTSIHWINADINPHFFPFFYEKARAEGMGHRVSAVFADAHALPFRDNYADVLVSRGCFFYWEDKPRAFAEIYRVLKPGGIAYVGRGFSRDLPSAVAQGIRDAQKRRANDGDENPEGPLKYDPAETEIELRQALDNAGVTGYVIERPSADAAPGSVNYGIWVTIRKPR